VVTQQARDILQTVQPWPLPDDVRHRLAEIAGRAEAKLAGIQFIS
jgi:hypothetical protein